MDANYVFLCGMVWAQFGEEDAGLEVVRALNSPYEEVRVLARAMLEQATGGSKELIGQALAEDEITMDMASICGFENDPKSKLRCSRSVWFQAAST